jgi:hypothetical protein
VAREEIPGPSGESVYQFASNKHENIKKSLTTLSNF